MPAAAPAIQVKDLHKTYGENEAVSGINFEVAHGEVYGLLGPNGAGKTTTVEILEGYRELTSGTVSVLGEDPHQRSQALRQRVGIVLQSGGMYRYVTPREAITQWALFYPEPRDVEEVISLTGLEEKADERIRTLSGGQLRRVDFALALIGDPELIFLDEPTTGFDPAARRTAWKAIESLKNLGKTVVLTTHYLEEAQTLCDRVAIVQSGKIVAEGPPSELGSATPKYRVSWTDAKGKTHLEEHEDPAELLHKLSGDALKTKQPIDDLHVARPTLEDVYLELTEEEK